MIKFKCPTCGKSFHLPDEHAGRKGKCSCGAVLHIPGSGSGKQVVPQDETTIPATETSKNKTNANRARKSDTRRGPLGRAAQLKRELENLQKTTSTSAGTQPPLVSQSKPPPDKCFDTPLEYPDPDEMIKLLISCAEGKPCAQVKQLAMALADEGYMEKVKKRLVKSKRSLYDFFLACQAITGPVRESIVTHLKEMCSFRYGVTLSGWCILLFPSIMTCLMCWMMIDDFRAGADDRWWSPFCVLACASLPVLLLVLKLEQCSWAKQLCRAYELGLDNVNREDVHAAIRRLKAANGDTDQDEERHGVPTDDACLDYANIGSAKTDNKELLNSTPRSEGVRSLIAGLLGVDCDQATPGASLAKDLGCKDDDLSLIIDVLECEFNIDINASERLRTVGDAIVLVEFLADSNPSDDIVRLYRERKYIAFFEAQIEEAMSRGDHGRAAQLKRELDDLLQNDIREKAHNPWQSD